MKPFTALTTALSVFMAFLVHAPFVSAAGEKSLIFPPHQDKRFHWDDYDQLTALDLKGEKVSIFGPWMAEEKDYFDNVIAYFEAATGAEVDYAGSDSFEQQIVIDAQAGSAPNISVFSQPGLAADLASKGLMAPLGSSAADYVAAHYAAGDSWKDLATFKNEKGQDGFYGVFYRADLKSLVWYSPENFYDAGYEVPTTMEELKALTQKIVADGGTPWCIGIGSGAATGWPATDWVEDLLLRTQPAEVYDKWITNEIQFDDPKIVAAIEEFGWFAKQDDHVDGGSRAVSSTDFRDSPKGMFSVPPKCYMHRQASFVPSFFPEGTVLGLDADFFYFPAYESKPLGKPVMGGGTMLGITNDSKGTRAFMDFILTPLAHELWMAQKSFLTAHKGVNVELYASDVTRKQGEILHYATTFRFDGSDLMPGKVGAGAFWTGMVDYTSGQSAQSVANDIQTTWNALK